MNLFTKLVKGTERASENTTLSSGKQPQPQFIKTAQSLMSIIEKYSYFMINITSVSSKYITMVIKAASEKKKALHVFCAAILPIRCDDHIYPFYEIQ